jgi:hypothetical protein
VNGLFLRERTKTSRNVTISFSQSPERATATRGRVQLVRNKKYKTDIRTFNGASFLFLLFLILLPSPLLFVEFHAVANIRTDNAEKYVGGI